MPPEPASREGLQAVVDEKLQALRALLAQIGADLDGRLEVSGRVLAALDAARCELDAELLAVDGLGGALGARRAVLEERLVRVEAERRAEWVRTWQDVAALRAEWRRTWREGEELRQRVALLAYQRPEAR